MHVSFGAPGVHVCKEHLDTPTTGMYDYRPGRQAGVPN